MLEALKTTDTIELESGNVSHVHFQLPVKKQPKRIDMYCAVERFSFIILIFNQTKDLRKFWRMRNEKIQSIFIVSLYSI